MKADRRNRWIHGDRLNRLIKVDFDEVGWAEKFYAVIERRKQAVALAIRRHWAKGGQVLEYAFGHIKSREPGVSPDSLQNAESLSMLLACRLQGFGTRIELVNLGPDLTV